MKTLVTNGIVVTSTTSFQSDLLIENGRIGAIGSALSSPNATIIDAAGCYVMPGGIDVHTHLNLEVGGEKVSDGFYAGSAAAAFGGTTTIVEHPGFGPPGCDLNYQTNLYHQQADREMVIDYGLHAVIQHVDRAVLEGITLLPEQGIASLKVYLTYSGRLGDEAIIEVLKTAHAAGVRVAFHAENHAIISSLTNTFRARGHCTDPGLHPASRPDYAEAEAVFRLIQLARAAGEVPVYIVHLSTAAGLDIIRKARRQGREVYAETCPQYLCLNETCYQQPDGLQYVLSPPLRRQEDCDALWDGLGDGSIDVVATDHCSFSLAQKMQKGKTDIFAAPGGIPGVETRMPLLFSEGVVKKRIDLNRFVRLTATNPAKIMGLAPQKGDLIVGGDADIIILEPRIKKTISSRLLHQDVDYTPFAGMEIQGWPTTVIQRGQIVIKDEQLKVARGAGSFVQRKIQ